jgi:hypothetical protein
MKMELKGMVSNVIDIEKNEILRDIIRDLTDQALREQMQTKFGPLPKWAEERLSQGSAAQMERWARKILAAKTLESVLAKK